MASTGVFSFLLFLLSCGCGAQELIKVTEGQRTYLNCFYGQPIDSCIWTKSDGSYVPDNWGVYQYLREYTSGNCSLIIKGALLEIHDSGFFCKANRGPQHYSTIFTVDVQVKPFLPFLKSNGMKLSNKTVLYNDRGYMRIECISDRGKPRPNSIQWRLNGLPLISDGLEIDSGSRQRTFRATSTVFIYVDPILNSRFHISCLVDHPTLDTTSQVASLFLEPPNYPEIRDTIHVPEGMFVSLGCNFASSIDSCFWTKDNHTMSITDRYSLQTDLVTGKCNLLISEALVSQDNGIFRCHANRNNQEIINPNDHQVIVEVAPSNPYLIFKSIRYDEDANITITSEEPNATITCISDRAHPPTKIEIRINGKPADILSYTIKPSDRQHLFQTESNAVIPLKSSSEQQIQCIAYHPTTIQPKTLVLHLNKQ